MNEEFEMPINNANRPFVVDLCKHELGHYYMAKKNPNLVLVSYMLTLLIEKNIKEMHMPQCVCLKIPMLKCYFLVALKC